MKYFSQTLCLLLLPLLGLSQDHILSQKVREAKANKQVFSKPSLFSFGGQAKASGKFSEIVNDGQLLTLDLGSLKSLHTAAPTALEIELPTGTNKPLKLELVKHQLLTEDFTLLTSSSDEPLPYQPGVYYRGVVNGDAHSFAAISIFEDEIIGVLGTEKDGNMVLGRTDGPQSPPITFSIKIATYYSIITSSVGPARSLFLKGRTNTAAAMKK